MRDNERKVLRLLARRSEPITAADLAAAVGVSERSARTYVRSINQQAGETCVESGRSGYWCHGDVARRLLGREEARADAARSLPQTNAERRAFVVSRVLRDPRPVGVADLAEELHVSESTMRLVTTRARRYLDSFGLELRQEGGCLSVRGTERDKRRAVGDLLYEETKTSFLDVATIQRSFPDIDASRVREVIIGVLDRHRLFINAYSLVNIVLHVAIALDRLRFVGSCPTEGPDESARRVVHPHDLLIADEIADALKGELGAELPRPEREELALLISTSATELDCDGQSEGELERIVGRECLGLVGHLVEGIEAYYFINLASREFFVRFALHVRNLLARADQGLFSRNPLTDEVRATCPLLYDIGVYCAGVIREQTGLHINDDEIAYLAFHLGGALETQRQLADKVRCVLYSPAFYNLDKTLQRFVESHFSEELLVYDVATTPEELAGSCEAELVVASGPLPADVGLPVCRVGIAPRDADAERVRAVVTRIKRHKRQARFRELLEALVAPELFFPRGSAAAAERGREGVIDTLVDALVREGYVEPGFADEVWEREGLSSTAFGPVAVAHALKPHAERSGIAVLVPDEPVDWGGPSVSLVLMLAFRRSDRAIPGELLDPLITVLADPAHTGALVATRDRASFVDRLVGMVE